MQPDFAGSGIYLPELAGPREENLATQPDSGSAA